MLNQGHNSVTKVLTIKREDLSWIPINHIKTQHGDTLTVPALWRKRQVESLRLATQPDQPSW